MNKRTFIFTVFCVLSIHMSLAVSEGSKTLPLPKLEELQLPLLPIEEGQIESKNGDIQQPRSAQEVLSVRNKTNEGSVTDLSTLLSSDVDDKDSYSDDNIEEVSLQPKHVTESDVQSEETTTGSSTKEDELADPVDIEQQKLGGNRQQMPSNTQQFPPGHTLPSWFRNLWPNDTFQEPKMSENAASGGVDGFSDDPIDDFYFFDYDDDIWDTLADKARKEQSERQGESQTKMQDGTLASSEYREQDGDQLEQDQSQSEQDVSTDVDWKQFKPDSDDDDDEEEEEESVSDDGTVTETGFGDEKQASSPDLSDVEDDDDGYDYDSYDDNDSINNNTDGYKDENDETINNLLGIDRIVEESADDITGKDTNLDDGDGNFANNESDEDVGDGDDNFANNESDEDDDKVLDITGQGENLDDNDSNSISWESDEDDDNTAHNITENHENINDDNDGFNDKPIDITQPFIQSPEEVDRYSVRTGSEKDDSDKDDKLDKVDTESEEEDYKSDKDDSQEEDDINLSKEHDGTVADHDAEEDDDDDDDEYFVWSNINKYQDKNEDLEDEKDGNDDDDDDEEFDETNEDFTGEAYELAKKSKQPTAPSSMILFYTWMIVAVLIVIIIISTYRAHCKGFRFLGMKATLDRRDDRKRLIEHDTV